MELLHFFLANAVDDIEMGITHVIRGDDLDRFNSSVSLALRRALGNDEQPFYAHTPMILAPDKSKVI
jgi:glutamyl-tRNA synthetase